MSGINLGLERVARLMQLLPRYTRPTVHVAGTNGKGSVTTMIETVLREAGFSTGRLNSPHLVSVWDSISFNTQPIPESRYSSTRQRIQNLDNEHSIGASNFEQHTASALSLFEEEGVDVVVLEVGMGGLTDATNIVPDDAIAISAITSVDYDHQGFLGNTISEIATHKVGIVRPNRICIVGPQAWSEAERTIQERIQTIQAHSIAAPRATLRQWDSNEDGSPPPNFSVSPFHPPPPRPCSVPLPVRGGTLSVLVSLHGEHQLENISTAVAALDALRSHPSSISHFPAFQRINDQHIKTGLRRSRWPGRLSWHAIPSPTPSKELAVLVDGAHNAASATALSAYIDTLDAPSRPIFILALSHSPAKPPATTLAPLLRSGDRVIVTGFSPVEDMPWVCPVESREITAAAENLVGPSGHALIEVDLQSGLARASELADGTQHFVVIAGSLYLVADFYRLGTFVVPHVDGRDDSPAVVAALANYSSDSLILFKKGVTYNLWTPINFGTLKNSEVAFEGNATYPTDIATVQAEVAKSTFPGHWIKIAGTNVTLRGTTDPNWGWIDSHGQQWWDAVQQANRPHGISFVVTNGVVKDMKLWQPIAWNFLFNAGKNIHAFNNRIHAVSTTKAFPFNTDGFAAGGTNLLIENNHIVNGDDCITVGSGANGVHFRNNYCEGGHGMSIGSLGKAGAVASVQNILFENVVMKNHLYGARFKSWTGGNGIARNITWRNIVLNNVPFPIYVTQNYWDQNLGPKPTTDSPNNTNIEDMIFDNFSGTQLDLPYVEGSCVSDPCWYSVANATGKEIIVLDLYHNTTRNVVAKRISGLNPISRAKAAVMCDPTAIDNDVGFVCQNGPYVATPVGYTR
ncbi:glycoside hydrolase family 28 protein [Rhizoctonia solani 123E]|uniref:Glycoside hydrolase family 28 protein n=1 Tax=Rhizoctonia solani 123E TaxID=1423351 RepID=A0A074S5F2_9AGAM|nr:glycoside hydrolase family 28 protein [Rhizoctonia solani 123E]